MPVQGLTANPKVLHLYASRPSLDSEWTQMHSSNVANAYWVW